MAAVADLKPEVRELIEGANFAHIATTMPDGSPHSVAVWLGLEPGDRVAFYTQPTSQKARNLARDPRVAISITGHESPYKTARIRGRVVETRTGDQALAAMDEISKRYTGEPFPMRNPGVLFVIEPEHVSYVHLPFEHTPST